jgi:hypothetical protein
LLEDEKKLNLLFLDCTRVSIKKVIGDYFLGFSHGSFCSKTPNVRGNFPLDDRMAETSTDMSGIRKNHNQLAYNIETFINGMKSQ